MTYISAHELANRWGISKRRVQTLCATNRINNATRIGNMWVVPDTSLKPDDARVKAKNTSSENVVPNPIKSARARIKALSGNGYKELISSGFSTFDAKRGVVALFAIELLTNRCVYDVQTIFTIRDNATNALSNLLEYDIKSIQNTHAGISNNFRNYILEHPFCNDDALAWCYQYLNKASGDTGIESTQFFTEKYMITTLIDPTDICTTDRKILDPACGGGNFLLYALDHVCDYDIKPREKVESITSIVQNNINRLYGYEIDPTLALVASINLRLKAISILKNNGVEVTVTDFLNIEPNVFYSDTDSKWGALDINKEHHIVRKVGCIFKTTMYDIFSDTQYLFTNPPFQTVKGMEQAQKDFLKQFYPNAKCDMCNAFIELSTQIVRPTGMCGLVTQNSWLHLNSFEGFKKSILTKCSLKTIIELGSNAFYDISGEKTNILLLSLKQEAPTIDTSVSMFYLKNLKQPHFERLLSMHGDMRQYQSNVLQSELLIYASACFDMVNSISLKAIMNQSTHYGEFATPMQGTSTGNAKELIGYYWENLGDDNWIPVSKGGGYSRWQGLNNYSVKWGNHGEFIMATKGSAIRNTKHFADTQLVFSDTGTAGLNVRVLKEGQLFVASGPGIRVSQGDPYAHLGFLNSRFATYYIKLLSPKLTIAAGYIAKIPVKEELLFSNILSDNAKKCLISKQRRLEKRAYNIEFKPIVSDALQLSINERALLWFIEDMEDEWTQLCSENTIDEEIYNVFSLTEDDKNSMKAQIGERIVYLKNQNEFCSTDMEKLICESIDVNCTLTRTRISKSAMGCDGVIEYAAQKTNTSCECIYNAITLSKTKLPLILAKYKNLYLHALILSVMGYQCHHSPSGLPASVKQIIDTITSDFPTLVEETSQITAWIRDEFTVFHAAAFCGTPLFYYNRNSDTIELMKGSKL